MDIQQVLNAVSTVGFPIVVAGYLLVRFESVLKENTRILQELVLRLSRSDDK